MNLSSKNIALIGFMGTGKSTIGRLIATKLGHRFVDIDHLVVERAGMEIGEIFQQHGEAHFRELEAAALRSLDGSDQLVIATGGGLVTQVENVALLRQMAFVAWLTADEEAIFERVSRNTRRPLVQTANPRETIHALLEERAPLYRAAAEFTVDTSASTHADIADLVIHEARLRFDSGAPS